MLPKLVPCVKIPAPDDHNDDSSHLSVPVAGRAISFIRRRTTIKTQRQSNASTTALLLRLASQTNPSRQTNYYRVAVERKNESVWTTPRAADLGGGGGDVPVIHNSSIIMIFSYHRGSAPNMRADRDDDDGFGGAIRNHLIHQRRRSLIILF